MISGVANILTEEAGISDVQVIQVSTVSVENSSKLAKMCQF